MSRVDVVISPMGEADLKPVLTLLAKNGLPDAGFADHSATALVAREDRIVVGSVALELHGPAALLRSLAVTATRRGEGLGRRLTLAALALARRQGVDRVYLLTETAEGFFARFGFEPVERAAVDPAVKRSVEFTSACPASAVAMMLKI